MCQETAPLLGGTGDIYTLGRMSNDAYAIDRGKNIEGTRFAYLGKAGAKGRNLIRTYRKEFQYEMFSAQ